MKIGFIGLGNMGAPMARHVKVAGHEVLGYDLDPESAREALGSESTVESAADLVGSCDAVLTMLPSGPAIEELILGGGGLAARWLPGLVLLDMGTTGPSLARRLADGIHRAGGRYLEAPVSGGTAGAQAGALTIIAAGDRPAFEDLAPVLDAMGAHVYFVGPPGAGQTIKLANNLLLAVNVVAVGEAWSLVRASGVDPRVAHDILKNCSGDSRALRTRVPEPDLVPGYPPANDYEPGFTLELMIKDALLAEALAQEVKVATPTLVAARHQYERAVAEGFGGRDIAVVAEILGSESSKSSTQ